MTADTKVAAQWQGGVNPPGLPVLVAIALLIAATLALCSCGSPPSSGAGNTAAVLCTSALVVCGSATPHIDSTASRASTAAASPAVPCRPRTPAADSPADANAQPASLTDVLCLVAAAPAITSLPADLRPGLDSAETDYGLGTSAAKQCFASFQQVAVPECSFGDLSGSRSIVLLGDSFAFMWLPAFDAAGKRLHAKVTLLSKASCPPLYISVYNPTTESTYPECDRWHDYVIGRINQSPPDLLIVTSTSGGADSRNVPIPRDAWTAALRVMLDKITLPSSRKAVLASVPFLGFGNVNRESAAECLAAHEGNIQACSQPARDAEAKSSQPSEQQVAMQVGATYIDVNPWLCSTVCTAVVGNMLVYGSGYHLSATYAAYLSGVVQLQVQALLDRE